MYRRFLSLTYLAQIILSEDAKYQIFTFMKHVGNIN